MRFLTRQMCHRPICARLLNTSTSQRFAAPYFYWEKYDGAVNAAVGGSREKAALPISRDQHQND